MKRTKQFLSVLLALLMVFSIIPMASIEAEAATLTQSQFDTKLSEVRAMYPHGSQKYEWSVNGSVVGWQCHGYGRWISWYVWGVDFANGRGANWILYKSTSSSTYIDSLVPGDVVRYRTSTSKSWNHTIFITGISGSTIYYTDCNSDGSNTIKWNQTVSKSTLASYLKISLYGSEAATYGYIAHYTPNTLLGGSTSCSCSTSYAGTYVCTTSSLDLTIRSGHGSSYSAIGSIPPGATVEVTKASGTSSSDWAHVTYNGISGYASMQYLTKKQAGQERDNTIRLWFSDSEYGNSVESVRTGERLYFCYRLFDKNTGDSFDSYVTDNYSVKLTIYGPDGSEIYTATDYDDSNWIYIKNTTPGQYTGEAVFTWEGGEGQKYTRYAEMVYEPRITPSVSDVQLSITGTNSKTISISYSGATNSDYIYMDCTTSGDCFSYEWGDWNDGIMSMTITGIRAGQGVITLELRDYDTDELLATEKVYVTVVAPTYTVNYNANGGTGTPSSQTKYHNTTLTLSSTKPTRTGYTFLGWSTSSTATSVTYSAGGNFTSNSNTTLYAVWKANTYTVKYNANGGSGSMSNSSHTYDVSKSLTSNAFTRSGYTFLGWSTNASATSATYTNGQSVKNLTSTNGGTVNLYAVWSKNATTSYTLSYNANGGTGAPSSQTGSTSYTISSTVPTRFGYTFLGWSKSNNATSGTYEPGDSITLSSNTTLYAVWRLDSTSITADSSYNATISTGGEMKYYTFTPSSSGKYVIYSTSTEDTRVYLYNSSGTELDSDDDDGDGNNFRLEYNLTAGTTYRYGIRYYNSSKTGIIPFTFGRVYNVTYYANGGTGAPSSAEADYGATFTLSSTTPTRSGYIFLGWSKNSSATYATYEPGDSITISSNTTLYAVWSKNQTTSYTLSYNANGGTGAPSSQSGSTSYIISSVVPTKAGYTFIGWSAGYPSDIADFHPNEIILITADTTLYAVWQKNPVIPDVPDTNFTFSIQEPSRTTIRNKDGIILHANVEGTAPAGSYVIWTSNNSNFDEEADGNELTVIAVNKGYTTFTATLYDADGSVLATDSVELYSKSGFFDKIGGFFRSLFGSTKIYEN